MKLLIDCDYIVYKCCAAAETELDFGDDVIVVTSQFSEAMKCVEKELDKIRDKISRREMFYDHFADKSSKNKWDSDYKLKKIDTDLLPRYLVSNREKYFEWFDL